MTATVTTEIPDPHLTADPADKSTWHKPCCNCGHTPGCEWQPDWGYACCSECFTD